MHTCGEVSRLVFRPAFSSVDFRYEVTVDLLLGIMLLPLHFAEFQQANQATAAVDDTVSNVLAAGADSEQPAVQQQAQQFIPGKVQQQVQGRNSSAELLINESAAITVAAASQNTVGRMLAAGTSCSQADLGQLAMQQQQQVQQRIPAVVPEPLQQVQGGNDSAAATDDLGAAAEHEQLSVADTQAAAAAAAAAGDIEMVPAMDDSDVPLDILQQQHSAAAEGRTPAQIAATQLLKSNLEQRQQQDAATPRSPAVLQQSANKWSRLQSRGFMALAQMTLRRTVHHTPAATATAAGAVEDQVQQQRDDHIFPAHFGHQQHMAAAAAAGRQQRATAGRPAATATAGTRKRQHSSTSFDSVIIMTSSDSDSSDRILVSDVDEVVIVGRDTHQRQLSSASPAAAAAVADRVAAARSSVVPAAAAAKRGRAVVAEASVTAQQPTAAQAAVVLPVAATLLPEGNPDSLSHQQKQHTRGAGDNAFVHLTSFGRRSNSHCRREGNTVESNLRQLHDSRRALQLHIGNDPQQQGCSTLEDVQPPRLTSPQQQQQEGARTKSAATASIRRVLPPGPLLGDAAATWAVGSVSGAAATRPPPSAAVAQTAAALRALMTPAAARLAASHQALASRPSNVAQAAPAVARLAATHQGAARRPTNADPVAAEVTMPSTMPKCPHGRQRNQCKDCGGTSMCKHGRQRSQCCNKDCAGARMCIHNKQRNRCKDCGGASICSHNRRRSQCKDCGGASICSHNRQRAKCKDCGGAGICSHDRQRSKCRECGGGEICPHNRQRYTCTECGGSGICRAHPQTKCGHIGNRRYDRHCTHCFAHLFPGDPRTASIRCKTKELMWVNALLQSEVLALYEWHWDKPLYVDFFGGCCDTKRRIDLWAVVGNTIVAIEIDEHQHKNRAPDYEEARYNDLFMSFSGRYIFLRVNPDAFKAAGTRHDPPFLERLQQVEQKLEALLAEADQEVDPTANLVQVHHMFYDT